MTDPRRSHPYDPDPRSSSRYPSCAHCAQTRAYRAHQPLWWRFLHPQAKWR